MTGMIPHAEQVPDDLRDTRERPQVGGIASRQRAVEQHALQPYALGARELGRASRSGPGLQPAEPVRPVHPSPPSIGDYFPLFIQKSIIYFIVVDRRDATCRSSRPGCPTYCPHDR